MKNLLEYGMLVMVIVIIATNSIRMLADVNTTLPSSVIVIGIAVVVLLIDKISERHKDV